VVPLVKVKKRSEDFNKAKLKASMKKAGAKDSHATKIADARASNNVRYFWFYVKRALCLRRQNELYFLRL
jgi:hypothetical protein